MDEKQLENLCLNWFHQAGWETAYGPDISPDGPAPERKSYKEVVLKRYLAESLNSFNTHLPPEAIEDAISTLLKLDGIDVRRNNHAFHRLLLNGIPVRYRQGEEIKLDHALIVDFKSPERNHFLAVNQFTIQGNKQLRRPDIVCFLNGLPIALIELKNPTDENTDIWYAYNQIQTYLTEMPEIFFYNGALIISDGFNARIGSISAAEERFLPWRTVKDEDDKPILDWQLEIVIKGFFNPALLTEYLHYFILFESGDSQLIKKMAGYHQFHGVREAVRATLIASKEPPPNTVFEPRAGYGKEIVAGSKKAGIVWHTQGSGKSISMCFYVGMLLQQPDMKNPTFVVVTDRNDLDGQLFQTFLSAHELLKQNPVQAENREELRRLLTERESGGIIFSTIQKFALLDEEDEHPELNLRHNIVVISDEAHRSQDPFKLKIDAESGRYKYSYAKHLRVALPNASFIGFTGTPLAREDKDTRAVFGDYVSIYDIQDAVEDGATVPIYYESRLSRLDLNHKDIEMLSNQVEEVVEDEEDIELREKTKGKWTRLEKLVSATPRINEIADDVVRHFEERLAIMDGKGMIVAMSREICVHLYNAIINRRPEWHDSNPEKGNIKIVMTGSAADTGLLQPHIYNRQTKKRLEKRFKDPADPLKLVIVRDMWLTGFDAPCCHTMYIDKPMKDHNLMQAIARVNRVFRNKPGGLVVDYIGIANELKEALKTYTEAKGKGEPTLRAEEAFTALLEKIDAIRGMFATAVNGQSFTYLDFEKDAYSLLIPGANHILGLPDGKKRFLDAVLSGTKAYALCGTLYEAEALHKELAFFTAIKVAINRVAYVDKKRELAERDSILKQILDNAIVAERIVDVFALAGLSKPNIGLLSDEFMEEVRQMPYRNIAIELLEKLIKDSIYSKARNNVVQERKYSQRLQDTLREYNRRGIVAAQVIEELIAMAKEFRADLQREMEIGLNADEIAFYDALVQNESAVQDMNDATLKALAREITEKLRHSTTVDWQVRESVRAKLRILVRRILQKYKYPPIQSDKAIELIILQAEALSNQWSTNM
jgi:type I restriction enzyme R subunit